MAKKINVKPNGQFMIWDSFQGVEIMPDVVTSVEETAFIRERVSNGQLIIVGNDEPAVDGTAPKIEVPVETIELIEEPVDPLPDPIHIAEDEPTVDANADGHDDATGEFVEGNQEAAKPRKRGRK